MEHSSPPMNLRLFSAAFFFFFFFFFFFCSWGVLDIRVISVLALLDHAGNTNF